MKRIDDDPGGFFGLTVGRPVALMVLFVTLIVIGLIGYQRIPLALLPSGFSEPSLFIWIGNPGASAQENEEKVTRVLDRPMPGGGGLEHRDPQGEMAGDLEAEPAGFLDEREVRLSGHRVVDLHQVDPTAGEPFRELPSILSVPGREEGGRTVG